MMKTFSFAVLALGLISTFASAFSPAPLVSGHPPHCPRLCPSTEYFEEVGSVPAGASLLLLMTSSPGDGDGYAEDECITCEPCQYYFTVHFESNSTGWCITFSRNGSTWTYPFASFHSQILVQANCKSGADFWLGIVPCGQVVVDPFSIYYFYLHIGCGCDERG